MKKKRLGLVAFTAALLILIAGCGSDKHLQPYSELKLHGADPPSFNVGVNPPLNHQTYFVFSVKLSDSSLSTIPADAWTIDSYQINYVLLSYTGNHLLALPPSRTSKLHVAVKPGVPTRLPISIVTDTYLADNASGFIGTTDTATVRANLVFRAHRNKDGFSQTMTSRFIFTIGNF